MTTSNVLTRRRLKTRVATVQQHDGHSMEWQHVRIKKITSGGPDNVFLSSTYFTEGRTDLPGEAICLEGSAPYFPRKYKATYDFPGRGGGGPPIRPMDPPMGSIMVWAGITYDQRTYNVLNGWGSLWFTGRTLFYLLFRGFYHIGF